jgi:hypothetical protein
VIGRCWFGWSDCGRACLTRSRSFNLKQSFVGIALALGPSGGGNLRIGRGNFDSHLDKFAALATRFAMPTIHALGEFVTSGGLMSYGADLANAYRLVGIYTGRILKGEGHPSITGECPLLGAKRTSPCQSAMSAFDPKRTFRPMV